MGQITINVEPWIISLGENAEIRLPLIAMRKGAADYEISFTAQGARLLVLGFSVLPSLSLSGTPASSGIFYGARRKQILTPMLFQIHPQK